MKTLLTEYAEQIGRIILPHLIDGKVCLFDEITRTYTLYGPTKHTKISDDFNPDNYCILHDYHSTIGYSTPGMVRNYKVNKAYRAYKENQLNNNK
jgi:hypothetical protein